jgi:hypothetical protein
VSIFKSVLNIAKSALSIITGAGAATAAGAQSLWSYVTNEHNLLSWLIGVPELNLFRRYLQSLADHTAALEQVQPALQRQAVWIFDNEVKPAEDRLGKRITALAAWARSMFWSLYAYVRAQFAAAVAIAQRLTAAEAAARAKAVTAEHAAMLNQVKAALQAVNDSAASGWNTGAQTRLQIIAGILDDIAENNPLTRDLVTLLVNGVLDLAEIDDPLIRWGLGKLLSEVISKAGVDAAAGDLVSSLLGTAAAQPRASSLYDVCKDAAGRLNNLEQLWATFMADGGSDVEQAGREWKDLRGVLEDAAILGMFGLAVTDPQAWATAIADTAGQVADDALAGIVDLINLA